MEPADPSDFYAIHTCLRGATAALVAAVDDLEPGDRRRARALGRYWEGFAGELHLHHTAEDDVFYPALTERVAVAAEHIGAIEDDHRVIDELLEETSAAMAALARTGDRQRRAPASAVLGRLDEVLRRHLDFEDADVVPLFSRHFSRAEYEGLTAAALKSISLGQALFSVPFVATWVEPEVREQLLGTGGLPLRAVHRLTRRRHARLTAAALGRVRQPV